MIVTIHSRPMAAFPPERHAALYIGIPRATRTHTYRSMDGSRVSKFGSRPIYLTWWPDTNVTVLGIEPF